jgi:hypothetical protein
MRNPIEPFEGVLDATRRLSIVKGRCISNAAWAVSPREDANCAQLIAPAAIAQRPTSPRQPLSPEMMAIHNLAKRPTATGTVTPETTAASEAVDSSFNSAQGPGPGPIGPGPGCDLFPAPASVGASVPLTYFGPSPSTTNPSLVGPVQLLKSGTVDAAHGTITLPLYKGTLKGTKKNVWYFLTDVSDQGVADELGLNFSTKLAFAANAARTGNLDANGNIVFDKGTVEAVGMAVHRLTQAVWRAVCILAANSYSTLCSRWHRCESLV